jgi:hypothetical protein
MPVPQRHMPDYLLDQLEGLENAWLDDKQLYINPFEFSQQETWIRYKQITKGGAVRLSYTTDVVTYQFVGFYGNAGIDELDAAESWRPTFANTDRAFDFSFPMAGLHHHSVYCNDYKVNISRDMPMNLQYTFNLEEYAPNPSPGYSVSQSPPSSYAPGSGNPMQSGTSIPTNPIA